MADGVFGPTLGNVKAKMTLDIADLARGAPRVQRFGKDMGKSFDSLTASLNRSEAAMRSFGGAAKQAQANGILVASSMKDVNRFMAGMPNSVRPATQALGGVGTAAKTSAVQVTSLGTKIRGLGASISAIAGPLGLVFGVAGLVQLTRFTLAVDALATSYKRQSIAAVNLAGSQANLNALMEAYGRATGGAIDKATALGDVTRLQAIGFADSAQELERFVTVARGISLAMGKQQQLIIGELQLAIANQSIRRLDQIGLGVAEVNQRIDELRTANSALTREMAFQEAVLGIAEEKYGALADSAEAQATGAEKAAKAWKDMRLEIGLLLGEPVSEGLENIADDVSRLNKLLAITADLSRESGDNLRRMEIKEQLRADTGMITPGGGFINRGRAQIDRLFDEMQQREANLAARAGGMARAIQGTNTFGRTIGPSAAGPDFSGQQDAIQAWTDQIQAIESQANQARLDATQQFEQKRTDTIAKFEQTIAREAEDFARQRARAEATHLRAVQDVREAAVRRESDLTEDHAERVEDINESHADKIEDIEENSARRRQDLQESHRDKILQAAGRLDAMAIAKENRRFQTQLRKIARDEKEKTKDANESTGERLKDEQKGFEKRRERAREADEERIQDMEDNFRRQKEQEDEDRALRLGRMKVDHDDQLEAQAIAHGLRLEQIEKHAADEREQLDTEFEKTLAKEGIKTRAFITEQELRAAAALRIFEDWWKDLNDVMRETGGGGGAGGGAGTNTGTSTTFQQFARGGPVSGTGRALVHAGEFVLNSNVTESLRAALGNFSQPELVTAVAGGGGGVSLTVAPGAIQINEAVRPGDTGQEMEDAFLRIVRSIT